MIHRLENGLSVLIEENRIAPVVALQMWVHVGSADEPRDMAGVAHLLEHMVFKGQGVGELAKEIEGAGGDVNAWTSFDETVYHIVMASRFFRRGLKVLSDAMLNTRIEAEELQSEIEVVLEEIKGGEDTPGRIVSERLFSAAYRQHPYRHPVIGSERSVAAMTEARVSAFLRQHYRPEQMTLVIVGDIERKRALRQIEKLLGGRWPAAKGAAKRGTREPEPRQRSLRITVEHKPVQEAHVALGFHMPNCVHEDTPALDLAAAILGQGDSSRLARRVRHQRELATHVYAYAFAPKDPGVLILGAATPPEKAVGAVGAVADEAFALAHQPVTATELNRARTIIESDAVYQRETVEGQARKLGFYQTVAGDVTYEEEYYRQIGRVTPADLQEVAARYFTPANLTLSLVVPEAKATTKELRQALKGAVKEAAARAHAAPPEREKLSDKVLRLKLPNGARLLFQRDTSVPLIAVRATWKGGVRYEDATNNGINSMLAALMNRGTLTRTADEINGDIESMAGSIAGYSARNSFGLRAEWLSRHWEQGLEIVADVLRNPAFTPDEVERQRRETLNEIHAQRDNVATVAFQLFHRTLYREHPYRLRTLGSEASVRRLSRKQLVNYYRQHFSIGDMVFSVVGDLEPERLAAKFRQLFGDKAPRGRPPKVPAEPKRSEPATAYETVDKEQAHIVMGFPGTTVRHRDRFALEVLAAILSGQSGRLFVELRDRQGLAYRLTALSQEGLDPGFLAAYMATRPENVVRAVRGFEEEFEKLRRQKVSASELLRAQRYLVGTHDISLQRRAALAAHLAFNELYALGHDAHLQYGANIMAVTVDDLLRVARRYLDDSQRVIAVVHPEVLSPGAEEALGQLPGRPSQTDTSRRKKGLSDRGRRRR